MIKAEQISMFPPLQDGEDADDIVRQVELFTDYAKKKRSWENAFRKWSNDHGIEAIEHIDSYGCCGYGSMCDWCEDNSYGRPCVRALNKMCREKGLKIDYSDRNFERLWMEGVKEY